MTDLAIEDAAPEEAPALRPKRISERPLTARQREMLDAIQEHFRTEGMPPTLRWLGARMGIGSTNGVNDHLAALERKGFILRRPDLSRGIVLIDQGPEGEPVPYVRAREIAMLAWCVYVEKDATKTYDLRSALMRLYADCEEFAHAVDATTPGKS